MLKYDLPMTSRELCVDLVESTGVMLTPGSALGVEGYFRIGYAEQHRDPAQGPGRVRPVPRGTRVNPAGVAAAAQAVAPAIWEHLPWTPLVEFAAAGEATGATILVKCEHQQRTGSFKVRGRWPGCPCWTTTPCRAAWLPRPRATTASGSPTRCARVELRERSARPARRLAAARHSRSGPLRQRPDPDDGSGGS